MTEAEIQAAVVVFRKETEDLVTALVKEMFQIQYGEVELAAGVTSVIAIGTAYSSSLVYEVKLFEATDNDGVNVIDAVVIDDQLSGSFSLVCNRACRVRWQTVLKTPLINFWT